MRPDFLDLDDVSALHAQQLERFGGGAGVRDEGLLASAVAQPQMSFGGQWMHEDVIAMAAAYLYHGVSNHPFVDGNKRAGLLAALVFLAEHGVEVCHSSAQLYELTMAVAAGELDKAATTARLRALFQGV